MFKHDTHGVPTSRLDMLRRLPMFRAYSDEELVRVDALVYETTIPAGAALTVEGHVRRQVFIVLSGEAVASVAGAEIGRLRHGDLIGEMSLLNNQPQAVTVTAQEPLGVLVMGPRDFATWVSDPRAARWLANDLSQRLRVAAEFIAHDVVEHDTVGHDRATSLRGRRKSGLAAPVHVPA